MGGAKVSMKPNEGPVIFELANIEYNRQFVNCAKLALAKLKFTHQYEPSVSNNATIIHAIGIARHNRLVVWARAWFQSLGLFTRLYAKLIKIAIVM